VKVALAVLAVVVATLFVMYRNSPWQRYSDLRGAIYQHTLDALGHRLDFEADPSGEAWHDLRALHYLQFSNDLLALNLDTKVLRGEGYWPNDIPCAQRLIIAADALSAPVYFNGRLTTEFYDLGNFNNRVDAVTAALAVC
jgi:hypothetical protein